MTGTTVDQAKAIIIEAVAAVAPDVADEVAALDPTVDLWDALGLDSMDHLNVLTELAERTGVTIAERDYARLRGLQALAEHVAAHAGG